MAEAADTTYIQPCDIRKKPICPECNSERLYRDGLRYLKDGSETQRWLCRACGYRFSQPNEQVNITNQSGGFNPRSNLAKGSVSQGDFSVNESLNNLPLSSREDIGSHTVTITGKVLNTLRSDNTNSQLCALEKAKKLGTATETKTVAGEGKTLTNKGQFVKFLSSLENDGIQANSAKLYVLYLKRLTEAGANLLDPESVKSAIAKKENWDNATKALAVAAYSKYLNVVGGIWKSPRYRTERKIPYVPTEREIDSLIDGAKRKLSAYLLLLKETGMRSSEAWGLKWKDVDFERSGITLNDPLKHGTPRQFKVSNRLTATLNTLPKLSHTYIFRTDNQAVRGFDRGLEHSAAAFRALRHRQALKLQNPNLERISFHTFRHWYATMEFNKTKNLLHVQALLGHKDITTTTIYTHMVNFEADAYNTSIALNVDEARKLIEAGFEYVTGNYDDGGKIFRKLK